jgi:hypothetical protein
MQAQAIERLTTVRHANGKADRLTMATGTKEHCTGDHDHEPFGDSSCIDQATRNGPRPGAPEGVKPASAGVLTMTRGKAVHYIP